MPPHNLEAERRLLSALCLDNGLIDEAQALIGPDDFFRAAHGAIFRAIVDLRGRGREADGLTLADWFQTRDAWGQIGATGAHDGADALCEVLAAAPHAEAGAEALWIVAEKSTLRRTAEAAERAIRDCYAGRDSSEAVLARAFRALEDLDAGRRLPPERAMDAVMADAMAYRCSAGGATDALATPWASLDDVLGGLRPGHLVVIAGRPGSGKSILGLQLAVHAARAGARGASGGAVLLCSLEMPCVPDLAFRILSSLGGVPYRRLVEAGASLGAADEAALAAAVADATSRRLLVVDEPYQRAGNVIAAARRLARRGGLALVVVDYLQLLEHEGDRRDLRTEQVAQMTRRLRKMARDLRVPVVVLAQLNRAADKESRPPRLSDLRESGAIEQDADAVILLDHERPSPSDPLPSSRTIDLIVAKHRNGRTAKVTLLWRPEVFRVDDPPPGAAGIAVGAGLPHAPAADDDSPY
jgi:replicative DNA helicase